MIKIQTNTIHVMMERPLSFELIGQMHEHCDTSELQYALENDTVFGYVQHIEPKKPHSMIIQGKDDYYAIPIRKWKKDLCSPEIFVDGGIVSQHITKFKSMEIRDLWCDLYSQVAKVANEKHLYV